MTNKINGIDVSEYFANHYDDSGKLYAVEYKGNPLELQNAIKRLQEENEKLKTENEQLKKPCLVMPKVNQLAVPIDKYEKLYKNLEKIREIAEQWLKNDWSCYYCRSNMDEKLKEIIKLTRF